MYITVEELDKIIKVIGADGTYEKVGYEGISDEQKELLIEKAVVSIDNQLYRGRRLSKGQLNAFPRVIDGVCIYTPPSLKYAVSSHVLKDLKLINSKRLQLQSEGVVSIDTSGVKESYNVEAVECNNWLGYLKNYLY